jgi:predicted metal-dependent hydrolase
MVSGESHYFFGQRFRLRVIQRTGPASIVLRNRKSLELHVRPNVDAKARERVLQNWYREQLRNRVPPLLDKWETALGVQAADWGIKKMKTKWGACNVAARRIWLNLELAKKPVQCLEYLIVHELTHLLERQHNERFVALMNRHLPNWRLLRQQLNSEPLAHATWTY